MAALSLHDSVFLDREQKHNNAQRMEEKHGDWENNRIFANKNQGAMAETRNRRLPVGAENGGYPPTQNGDIRSLFWLFSLMALQN